MRNSRAAVLNNGYGLYRPVFSSGFSHAVGPVLSSRCFLANQKGNRGRRAVGKVRNAKRFQAGSASVFSTAAGVIRHAAGLFRHKTLHG